MSDLISRDDVNDLIKQICDACGEGEKYNGVMCRCCRFDDFIGVVDNIPSAESERKWIPVTEALPEEEKDVLVSVHFDGHKCSPVDYLPPSDYVEIASHVDGLWSSLSDEYKVAWKKHHVIAWMPLPEPWRGE